VNVTSFRKLTSSAWEKRGKPLSASSRRWRPHSILVARDSYLTIETINRAANTLTLRTSDGCQREVSPARWQGIQTYAWEQRTLAAGDRLQFRIHDKKNHIANGEFAAVTALKDEQATLRFDSKRELTLPLAQRRHIDYGYTSTSHSSQRRHRRSRHR
jgi:hypothetical protein